MYSHTNYYKAYFIFCYMKIGLDFDGVISDCGKLKSDGASFVLVK